ncbi:hypothetical protein T261_02889 [Streptomyces lydicus]|nr:hypothetical protein T261_02889 [Streptomyces lydicus]
MDDLHREVRTAQQEAQGVPRLVDVQAPRRGGLGPGVRLLLHPPLDQLQRPLGVAQGLVEFGSRDTCVLSDHAHDPERRAGH